jgi:hypothetical protein
MGAGLTLGGIILHSPWGQQVMTGIKSSQEQIAANQKDLQQAKKDLSGFVKPNDKQ